MTSTEPLIWELWDLGAFNSEKELLIPTTQSGIALAIAEHAHKGQFRRDGKTPYFTHPYRVWDRIKKKGGNEEEQAVALLHDVLEDTKFTAEEMLRHGIKREVIWEVEILTKQEKISYEEYLDGVRTSLTATKVKVEDILDNLSDSPSKKQIIKYSIGLLRLLKNNPLIK
jgi:(p)ppGpp synthase/HD superfamily hydrolase